MDNGPVRESVNEFIKRDDKTETLSSFLLRRGEEAAKRLIASDMLRWGKEVNNVERVLEKMEKSED